jgi:hypothetical protein
MVLNKELIMKYTYAYNIIISIIGLLLSLPLLAHQSCDIELSAGLEIKPASITFFEQGPERENSKLALYTIQDSKYLSIRGEKVLLTHEQLTLINAYDFHIRQLVPKVKNIAIEGVDIAIDGVSIIFNSLLGEDNTVGQELITELNMLKQQLDVNLSGEHDIIIGVDGLESDVLLGEEFEQRIESAMEKAVMGSMGSLLVALGKQMINDDEQGFENKIDIFSQTIEREMESRAKIIEDKVQKLCSDFITLEMIETQLQQSIAELQSINVFNVLYQ